MSISIMESKDKKEELIDIEDWDHYMSPPPKSTKTITVKVIYVGRAKPKPYYLEDDE